MGSDSMDDFKKKRLTVVDTACEHDFKKGTAIPEIVFGGHHYIVGKAMPFLKAKEHAEKEADKIREIILNAGREAMKGFKIFKE